MTGVNQTIMMAISMVVTCSMIGATGLGTEVLIGINRLERYGLCRRNCHCYRGHYNGQADSGNYQGKVHPMNEKSRTIT